MSWTFIREITFLPLISLLCVLESFYTCKKCQFSVRIKILLPNAKIRTPTPKIACIDSENDYTIIY